MNQNDSFDRAPELAAEEPFSAEQTAPSPYARAIELARALVSESDANQPQSMPDREPQSPTLSPDQFPSPEPPERLLFQSFTQ
ncbi:MAG: hypothetical protein ABR924_02200, partial [Terracidiphilus sp.]